MDRATPFLEGLVLPRGVLPLTGGALVIAPPHLLWCPDADGDLRADARQVVADGFGDGLSNPEHAGNSPLWGLDNDIHLANHPVRFRRRGDAFAALPAAGHGQWGLAQDDQGRLYCNYNSDWLRCDLLPPAYAAGQRPLGGLPGTNHQLVRDQSVFPIRVTPGVNRGYQPGMLDQGVLTRTTAVCGVAVYRGTLLADCRDQVFVCEPAGNLVRRFRLGHQDGRLQGANAHGRGEFLASTDERFRPVDLTCGPDGALYVVDMYRGVIQHRNFVTTWLRQQILARGLERPIGMGRIWRVLPADGPPPRPRLLAQATTAGLVSALTDPDGLHRDTAQRLLVERRDPGAEPALRTLLRDEQAIPLARSHALWTLSGLGALQRGDVLAALYAGDPWLATHGLRLAEPFLARGDRAVAILAAQAAARSGPPARWQYALSLQAAGEPGLPALAELALSDLGDPILRGCLAAGATGREVRLLAALSGPAFAEQAPGRPELLALLARRALASRQAATQEALLDRAAGARQVWQQRALLSGALAALPKGETRRGFLTFAATPAALAAIQRQGDAELGKLVQELLAAVAIAVPEPAADAAEDDPALRAQVLAGAKVFGSACAACHQQDGLGLAGLAPPLRESEWVLGDGEKLVKIALHGLRGPIEVGGERWELEMPPQGALGDAELAAVLTYLRRSWGHRGSAVTPADVAAVRAATRGRVGAFTADELR